MATLQLNDDARDALIEALEAFLSDMRFEISNTEKKDFRDMLKAKRDLLRDTLEKLKASSEAA